MRTFDVGIMPLPDEAWARGKCGFKLIQYMACGLPVVASPVGVNMDIVDEDVNGFLATDRASWVQALTAIKNEPALGRRMGKSGRKEVERQYTLQVTVLKFIALINPERESQ